MGRIQSNVGLSTGLDIQKTVDQLMSISQRPRDAQLNRVKALQSQQVALNEITALVVGLQLQTDRIGNPSTISTSTVSSSKSDVISASVSGTAVPGNYKLQVVQTAQSSTASSGPLSSSSDTLQAGEFVVRTGGFVDSSISLDELNGGAGVSRGIIQITDRSGQSTKVDLRFAATVDDVLKAINSSGARVTARTSGDRIVLSDISGQSVSNLVVEDLEGSQTVADLGLSGVNVASNTATGSDISSLGSLTRLATLKDNRGVSFVAGNDLTATLRDGTVLQIDANATSNPSTVAQLVSSINAKDATKFEIRIAENGDGFEVIDKTTGSGNFSVSGSLAKQLGLAETPTSSNTITGERVQNTITGPLLSTLRGGKGIGTPGSIQISDRNGNSATVNLSGSQSLRDVIERINSSGIGVSAVLNRSRTGITLTDVTGSTTNNFIVADADANNSATKLGIATSVSANSIDSKELGAQFISEATELSKLNQGRGVRLGSFTITNSAGRPKTVNLTAAAPKTVGDVLAAINDNAIDVTARLNDDGDGIVIIDNSGGTGSFSIAENNSGNTALDLGIRGSGVAKTSPDRQEINGSQTFRLKIEATDKLSDVAKKINEANGPVTASLLTSGPSTVRLLFTSRSSGSIGRFVANGDSLGLQVNSTGSGRDSLLSVGSTAEIGGTLVRSSTNNISNAIDGVVLNVKSESRDPIDVNVESSNSTLDRNLQLFVDQFNKVRDKIAKETEYNTTSKTTGILLGSSEVLRVEQSLNRFILQRTASQGGISSLQQLGLSFSESGKLELDKEKLTKAIQANPDGVKKYLTEEKTGFGARAKSLLDSLVGVDNSTLVNRTNSIQRQVEAGTARVDALNLRLERERDRLLKQFYALEESTAKIRSNTNYLSDIQSVLYQFQQG
jgi:flagellar hook-associated protein 2